MCRLRGLTPSAISRDRHRQPSTTTSFVGKGSRILDAYDNDTVRGRHQYHHHRPLATLHKHTGPSADPSSMPRLTTSLGSKKTPPITPTLTLSLSLSHTHTQTDCRAAESNRAEPLGEREIASLLSALRSAVGRTTGTKRDSTARVGWKDGRGRSYCRSVVRESRSVNQFFHRARVWRMVRNSRAFHGIHAHQLQHVAPTQNPTTPLRAGAPSSGLPVRGPFSILSIGRLCYPTSIPAVD